MVAFAHPSTNTVTTATSLPSAMNIRYVAGTGVTGLSGSDSYDGLSPHHPYATVQAAYDDLPTGGGTLILMNGIHALGSGFSGVATKPAVVTSYTGYVPGAGYFPSFTGHQGDEDQIAPSITCTGAVAFTIASDGTNQGRGWAFNGLVFDLRAAANHTGVWANDLNFLRMNDCQAEGQGTNSYLVRSNYTGLASDASWYRLSNNVCRLIGLCSLADGETNGNCNNNQIFNNTVFGSPGFAIKLAQSQRSSVVGNNLEGDSSMSGIQYLSNSHYNYTMFNGGEQGITPYVQYDSGCYSNVHYNFGSPAGAVIVNDLDGANSQASGSQQMAVRLYSVSSDKTTDYILASGGTGGAYYGNIIEMNKATGINFTIDTQANEGLQIGSWLKVRQKGAGQVTIVAAGGVTINSPGGALKTSARYGVVNLQKIDVNVWTAWGDLTT